MEKLSLKQKQYITEIADIHESELAKQNEDNNITPEGNNGGLN